MIQSLKGGIIESMSVEQGDVDQADQVLAQLSRTRPAAGTGLTFPRK